MPTQNVRFLSTSLRSIATSHIFAYNLGLCKMLSVATWKPLLLPPLLADNFPESFQLRKKTFLPTLHHPNQGKMRHRSKSPSIGI